MIAPDTYIEVKYDGIHINGVLAPNTADLQQQFTELKHLPAFELLIAHLKTWGYKDGFLEAKDWNGAMAGKAIFSAARTSEILIDQIISFRS